MYNVKKIQNLFSKFLFINISNQTFFGLFKLCLASWNSI